MARTFSIKMMVQTYYARLDDEGLELKMGPTRKAVKTAALRHLYLENEGHMQLLWLAYESDAGKLKRVTVGADAGDRGLGELIEALVSAHPHIDIRAQDRKAAMKTLGAMSRGLRLAIGFGIVLVVMVLLSVAGEFLSGAFE